MIFFTICEIAIENVIIVENACPCIVGTASASNQLRGAIRSELGQLREEDDQHQILQLHISMDL